MQKEVIEKLLSTYPGLSLMSDYKYNEEGDWFLLETNPFPSSVEEAIMVASDLYYGKPVFATYRGALKHMDLSTDWRELDAEIEEVIRALKPQSYKIAIWENPTQILNHQPVSISIDPEINYLTFPDHPHINGGDRLIPESLCYTENPIDLGEDIYTRMSETIKILNTWLFKHTIWVETRKRGKGIWIGPGVDFQLSMQFLFNRNPYGVCWCGNRKVYKDCHLIFDYLSCTELLPLYSCGHLNLLRSKFDIDKYIKNYRLVNSEQKKIMNELKQHV